MIRSAASFSAGEAIVLAIDVLSGDPAGASGAAAGVKAAVNGGVPRPSAPVLASFTVTPRAAAGEVPAGWTLSLPGGIAAPGLYVTDFRVTVGGALQFIDPIMFTVTPTVTGAA
jgi:hypothetical protein